MICSTNDETCFSLRSPTCCFGARRWPTPSSRLAESVSGGKIGRWLEIVGQFEALCSLASFAFEGPNDPFPEIVELGPLYEGEGLTHPLLSRQKCVANDLHLVAPTRVYLVSGSNMSGKSTFLRTIGINAVLCLPARRCERDG